MRERLVVLLAGRVAGHLHRSSPTELPGFSYAAGYLREGTVPLSVRLPLRTGEHPPAKVIPFLAGLLPEDAAARGAWAGELGVHPDDAFGILAAKGWDCAGAVQFCREEHLDALRAGADDVEELTDTDVGARVRDLAGGAPSWTAPGERWSLAGQQGKFALVRRGGRWCAARGSAATTHIVKPGISGLRHQALVEHATMRAAAQLGVATAGSTFTRFDDQWAVVVERFDRSSSGGPVVRTHQEDFAQACGRMPDRKYESDGGPTLADLVRVVDRSSTDPAGDRRRLGDHLVVNLVAGAPDGHAKNLGLRLGDGSTTIAPLYDLATSLSYDARDVDRTVALSIGGERSVSRIRRRQWERAARVLRLDTEVLVARAASLAEGFPAAFEAAVAELPDDAPGAAEVAGRTVPALTAHTRQVLDRLP